MRRFVGLVLAPLAACGDDAAPGGGGGTAATTGTASSTTAASTSSATTTSTAGGGEGGSGNGGGTTGTGGAGSGGAGPTCAAPAATMAAGDDFTCAVLADDTLRCRGGRFGEGWATIGLEGGGDARCVEHVVAEGAGLCFRTADGEGCPDAGAWCVDDDDVTAQHLAAHALIAVMGAVGCAFASDGEATCTGPAAPPSLDAIAPVVGVDGGAEDGCAWGASGLLCWGSTAALADQAPRVFTCPVSLDVGDGFACLAYAAFDVVDCWGDLPPGIPAQVFLAGPVEEVAVGRASVCARTTTGLVRCWGDDAEGALGVEGDGTTEVPTIPSWAGDDEARPAAIAVGTDHAVARVDDAGERGVLAWGRNVEGQVCACPADLVDTPTDAELPLP